MVYWPSTLTLLSLLLDRQAGGVAKVDQVRVDIDEDDAMGLGSECSDGNAIGPRWVH